MKKKRIGLNTKQLTVLVFTMLFISQKEKPK